MQKQCGGKLMAIGGFDREELQAPLAEINTTPLVDVLLVLVVIFLVTAPMLTQAIKLELPREKASQIDDQKVIQLSIDAKGQYYWDNQAISVEVLEQHLQEAAKENPKQPVHLRADTHVDYGKVSHIMAMAWRVGLVNMGFIMEPQ